MVKNKNKIILMLTAFAVFLATFNETFLNVAFDSICGSLSVDFGTVQWLATAYMLGAAIMVPVSAFLYRKVPTKALFLITVGFFIVGSVVAGVSQSFIPLLFGRVIQAIGSGMLIPISMNVVLDIAPREKLGSYMGVMGAMTTLGPSLSIILAGLLLMVGDWHILFYVFGGLSLILFILAGVFLGNVAHLSKPRLDILSVILITIALVGILYAISSFFTNYIVAIIALVVGAVCLGLFVWRQKKIPEPLINLEPLKNKAFTIAVILNMLALIMVFAFNILIPQFLQSVSGAQPLDASLTLIPAILLSCVLAPVAGKIYDKYGVKVLLPLGFALMAVFAVLVSVFIASPSYIVLALLYIPFIAGSALIIGPVQSYGLSFLKPEQNPHGVTIFSTGFQIAGCIGASLFASIYARCVGSLEPSTSFLIVGLIIAFCAVVGLVLAFIISCMKRKKPAITEQKHITIREIMKKDIYTVQSNATILDVMELFVSKKISGCPIVNENGDFVGFISDGDIVRFLSKNHSDYKFAYSYEVTDGAQNEFNSKLTELVKLNVLDVASKDLFWIDIDKDLGEVCRVLADMHKKKVPVLDNGKMVGIVTRSDITKYAMSFSINMVAQANTALAESNNKGNDEDLTSPAEICTENVAPKKENIKKEKTKQDNTEKDNTKKQD